MPDFPLVPASKGFCLSLDKSLESYKAALKAANLWWYEPCMLPFWLYAICQYNNLVFFTYDMDYSQYILCCAYKHLCLLNYLKLSPFKNGIFSQVNTLFASTKVPKIKALLKIPSNRALTTVYLPWIYK